MTDQDPATRRHRMPASRLRRLAAVYCLYRLQHCCNEHRYMEREFLQDIDDLRSPKCRRLHRNFISEGLFQALKARHKHRLVLMAIRSSGRWSARATRTACTFLYPPDP